MIEKLKPFMSRKSARQRIILYMIASGHTMNNLSKMTISDFKKLDFPQEGNLNQYYDVVLCDLDDKNENDTVFKYPGGRKMQNQDFYRIMTQASTAALGKSLSHKDFVAYFKN